jgi:anion-transporting  ArsA/GET3 family ATPase
VKQLLKKGSVLILLGTGGVGKTTIAAALSMAGAMAGLDTAVVTFDPARRLRDALGLAKLGGKPTRIDGRRLASAGLDPKLKLSAMVLDVKGAWDALVERFVEPANRQRILDNPFYRNLTEQFAGSDAYAALEQLYNLHTSGEFEFQVVDTPPAAHAFEFLQAPARLVRLLDSRAARWLFTPYMSASRFAMKLASRAARFVVRELERFAGTNVLVSISEFFIAAADAVDGVVDRLRKTEALLRAPQVHFVLVTTAEEDRLAQALELIKEMSAAHLRLSAIVVNRFVDEPTWSALARGKNGAPDNLQELGKLAQDPSVDSKKEEGLAELLDFLESYRVRALADIQRLADFSRKLPSSVSLEIIPEIRIGVGDLATLRKIAGFLTQNPITSSRLENAAANQPAAH